MSGVAKDVLGGRLPVREPATITGPQRAMYDSIIEEQAPWGKRAGFKMVTVDGTPYYAINQWLVAALQPPHLTAICMWEGAADWYRDWSRHGGILSQFDDPWFDGQVASVQHGVSERGAKGQATREFVAGPKTLSPEVPISNRAPDSLRISKR